MPRTTAQFEAIRQDTRQKIMETSFNLFSRNGFHATSVSKIAAEAGVSKGLMYNYFGGKEALLQAIVTEFFNESDEFIAAVLASDRSSWEKLEALIRLSFDMVLQQPEQCRLLFGLSVQEDVWLGIRLVLKQKMMAYIQILTPILEDLKVADPKKELVFLVSLLDGYSMHLITMKDEICDSKEMIDYIIEQLRHKYKTR